MLDLLKDNIITKVLQSSRLGVSALAIVALAGVFGPISLPIAIVIGVISGVYVTAKTAENINADRTSSEIVRNGNVTINNA